MGTAIIVSMSVATVASAVAQKILTSQGRADEAQYVDLFTKSGLAVTALGAFAKVVSKLISLG